MNRRQLLAGLAALPFAPLLGKLKLPPPTVETQVNPDLLLDIEDGGFSMYYDGHTHRWQRAWIGAETGRFSLSSDNPSAKPVS